MQECWVSKMKGKSVAHLAKVVILLAASLGALSLIMPSAGAEGRRTSSERDAPLAHITLEPSNPIIFGANLTQTLIVTGKYSDGSLRDLTRQASFTSSDPAVATIDLSGTVKAINNGQAWITAKVAPLTAPPALPLHLAHHQ